MKSVQETDNTLDGQTAQLYFILPCPNPDQYSDSIPYSSVPARHY